MINDDINQNYQEALRRIHHAKETRAISLDLSGLIWRRIPPELFEVTWLEELKLQQEKNRIFFVMLFPQLPKQFACFKQLRILDISFLTLESLEVLAGLTQLTSLSCERNNLTDLTPLTPLTQLTSLNCSNNQVTDLAPLADLTKLTTLNCSNNKVTNLTPLANLSQLTTLDCSNNQLTNLTPLVGLTQLTRLYCAWNRLTNLRPLAKLTQLAMLNCGGNRLLADLSPLAQLTQLTMLHCGANRLNNLAPLTALTLLTSLELGGNNLTTLSALKPAVLKGQFQHLSVFGNPVVGIPKEFLGRFGNDNVVQSLQDYWLDLDQGSESNRDLKILFVGNGCVGKSTLAYGLRFDSPPPSPITERTHAIEIETLEVPLSSDGPVLRWHLWDFGGQELYHATHRLFLHHQALFLLLWAEKTEESPDEVRHPVSYWLSFIQDLASDSPVFLVKNQIDRQDSQPRPSDLPEGSSPFVQELKISALRYQGVDTLKGAVVDYLKHNPERWAYDLPSSWLRLREDLESRRQARFLPRAHFVQLCVQHGVKHPETVLKYFHESGFLFFREAAFQDQIILDQNWMIDLIYRLFDPLTGIREAMVRQNGQFTGKDTERFWPNHDEADRQVIVTFLTASQMAFALDHDQNWNTAFEEQQFVLPALLPVEPPLGVAIWGGPQPAEWWVDCTYSYLHRGLIEAVIVRTAQLSPRREWWRDGVIFSDEKTGCRVLAQYAPEAGLSSTIRFRLRETGKPETLAKVCRLLEELHRHRQPEMWVSMDGTQFVSISALEQARQQGKTQMVSREQDIVEVQPYHMFLHLPELEEKQQTFPNPAASPRRIQIFISYAHKDEDPYKERLKVTIKNLARSFPIDVWDDRQLFAGNPWEPEILQKLEEADIVCLLISQDFIASDYCFSKELEKALTKYEQGKGIPIPILIRATSDWETFPIGKHQALPTPAKPLAQWSDPDEFWASVQQGLRQQIERLLEQKAGV